MMLSCTIYEGFRRHYVELYLGFEIHIFGHDAHGWDYEIFTRWPDSDRRVTSSVFSTIEFSMALDNARCDALIISDKLDS